MDDSEDVVGRGISMYWSIHNNDEEKKEVIPLEKKETDKRDLVKKSEEQIYWVFKTSIEAINKFLVFFYISCIAKRDNNIHTNRKC